MAKEFQDDLQIKLEEKAQPVINSLPGFCAGFFESLRIANKSSRTVLEYAYDLSRFFSYLSGNDKFCGSDINALSASDVMDRLTIDDIQNYFRSIDYIERVDKLGKRRKAPASPASRARKISSLRSFYKYLFKTGMIHTNLADLMDLPKIPEHTILVLDKSQIQRLLSAVQSGSGLTKKQADSHAILWKRDFAIIMLLLGTGIRVSELVGIDLADIDFYEASILIVRKGGDQDQVFFAPEVEEAIRDYVETCREYLCPKDTDEPALFLSLHRKRMATRSVEVLVKKYTGLAGINLKVSPHKLRSTFGTTLYEATGDIYLVADALHHSSIETTRRHYARMSRDHKREAARISSDMLKPDE